MFLKQNLVAQQPSKPLGRCGSKCSNVPYEEVVNLHTLRHGVSSAIHLGYHFFLGWCDWFYLKHLKTSIFAMRMMLTLNIISPDSLCGCAWEVTHTWPACRRGTRSFSNCELMLGCWGSGGLGITWLEAISNRWSIWEQMCLAKLGPSSWRY